eukprot:gene3171-4088_t
MGDDGQVDHLLVVAEDVTEKRGSAERLRLGSRVLAETADAVLICDAQDQIIDCNPAFGHLTGHHIGALVGRPVSAAGLPLFDGGRRAANVDAAQARYTEAVALYQARARQAVREVEEALVYLDSSASRSDDARVAAEGYRASFTGTEARYKGGLASLVELEDARRTALAAETALVGLQRERIAAWIALYRAAGGGWTTKALNRQDTMKNTKLSFNALAPLVLALLTAGGIGLWASHSVAQDKNAKAAPKPALTVSAVQPQQVRLAVKLAANGNLMAWQEASVGAETNGLRLTEVR